jgi:hypothetical protein
MMAGRIVERGRELLAEGQLIRFVKNPAVEDSEVRVEQDERSTIGIDAAGDVAGSLSSSHAVGHELGCVRFIGEQRASSALPGAHHGTLVRTPA